MDKYMDVHRYIYIWIYKDLYTDIYAVFHIVRLSVPISLSSIGVCSFVSLFLCVCFLAAVAVGGGDK